jgi:glutamate carboxypeptidase
VKGHPDLILSFLKQQRDAMLHLLEQFVLIESPTTKPDSQALVLARLLESFRDLNYDVTIIPGIKSGGHLSARPSYIKDNSQSQLLLGHCDTVWPIGTLKKMPFIVEGNIAKGPGIFDMKAGLVQMIFALKALDDLGFSPDLKPLVFINSDEEIGSVESGPHIKKLAQEVERAFVLEPSLGLEGKLKTARKGVGRFKIIVKGRAAHAGLDPDKGISAVLEMSYIIQKLFALNDPKNGISVNVGIVDGGVRPNVIAAESSAEVDVRVPTQMSANNLEQKIYELSTETPGTSLKIEGGFSRPPMERSPRNINLWQRAAKLGRSIDIFLEQGMAGGGSDGNMTSQFTATLDGLGAVGDGAHADHEFIYIDKMIERSALLALLLLASNQR